MKFLKQAMLVAVIFLFAAGGYKNLAAPAINAAGMSDADLTKALNDSYNAIAYNMDDAAFKAWWLEFKATAKLSDLKFLDEYQSGQRDQLATLLKSGTNQLDYLLKILLPGFDVTATHSDDVFSALANFLTAFGNKHINLVKYLGGKNLPIGTKTIADMTEQEFSAWYQSMGITLSNEQIKELKTFNNSSQDQAFMSYILKPENASVVAFASKLFATLNITFEKVAELDDTEGVSTLMGACQEIATKLSASTTQSPFISDYIANVKVGAVREFETAKEVVVPAGARPEFVAAIKAAIQPAFVAMQAKTDDFAVKLNDFYNSNGKHLFGLEKIWNAIGKTYADELNAIVSGVRSKVPDFNYLYSARLNLVAFVKKIQDTIVGPQSAGLLDDAQNKIIIPAKNAYDTAMGSVSQVGVDVGMVSFVAEVYSDLERQTNNLVQGLKKPNLKPADWTRAKNNYQVGANTKLLDFVKKFNYLNPEEVYWKQVSARFNSYIENTCKDSLLFVRFFKKYT